MSKRPCASGSACCARLRREIRDEFGMSAVLKARPVRLAPMTAADVDRVMEIETAIYAFPWTPGNFGDSIGAGYGCWLYLEGDAVVGYAVVMLGAGEAHLLNLSIGREHQGRGLGWRLLGALMDWAYGGDAHNMLLEVRPSNHGGIALYEKAGFVRLGVRKAYYPAKHGREDAWVYGRELRAGGTLPA